MAAETEHHTQYDHFRLSALKDKAIRLVFRPLVKAEFGNEDAVPDETTALVAIEQYLESLTEKEEDGIWHYGVTATVEAMLGRLDWGRDDPIAMFKKPDDPSLEADPRFSEYAFLRYLGCQIVENAVFTGDIICVAQDGGNFAAIKRHQFSSETEAFELHLPSENNPMNVDGISRFWCDCLGADHLWFAFWTDLRETFARQGLDFESLLVELDNSNIEESPPENKSRRGYEKEDEPFVQLAIKMIDNDEARNAHDAVGQIASDRWREVNSNAESFEKAVAGGGSYGSKSRRLENRVNARLKKAD